MFEFSELFERYNEDPTEDRLKKISKLFNDTMESLFESITKDMIEKRRNKLRNKVNVCKEKLRSLEQELEKYLNIEESYRDTEFQCKENLIILNNLKWSIDSITREKVQVPEKLLSLKNIFQDKVLHFQDKLNNLCTNFEGINKFNELDNLKRKIQQLECQIRNCYVCVDEYEQTLLERFPDYRKVAQDIVKEYPKFREEGILTLGIISYSPDDSVNKSDYLIYRTVPREICYEDDETLYYDSPSLYS